MVELFETKTELKKMFNPADIGAYFDQRSDLDELRRRIVRLDVENTPKFGKREVNAPGVFREAPAVEQRRHGLNTELLEKLWRLGRSTCAGCDRTRSNRQVGDQINGVYSHRRQKALEEEVW